MTDPATDPGPPDPGATGAAADDPRPPTFEERMEDVGRRAEAAGERWGREAQAAGARWSKDASVVGAADTAARVWGVLLLAVGLWFFADVTLRLDMPSISWRDVWPIALIVIGLVVVVRGFASRRA